MADPLELILTQSVIPGLKGIAFAEGSHTVFISNVVGLAVVPVPETKMSYKCGTRLLLRFPGSAQGLPFCHSGSICPSPRPLFIDVPKANPEATVPFELRRVLIIIYQLMYRHLNARKHIRTVI